MIRSPKSSTRRLVAFLGGASLAALSIAAPALAQTLSGAKTVTQTFSAADLNVATDANFSVTTLTANAVDLSGTNGLTFTDNYQSLINGADYGIFAYNGDTGVLSITSTGTVTGGPEYAGIAIENYGTNLTLTANNVTGGFHGIDAYNSGTGPLSITSTGTVTSTGVNASDHNSGTGIYASNSSKGTDFTVTTNNVTGYEYSILAQNNGTGALNITSTGTVTSTGVNASDHNSSTGI